MLHVTIYATVSSFVYFMPDVILNSFLKHCPDEGLEMKYGVVLLDVLNDCSTLSYL